MSNLHNLFGGFQSTPSAWRVTVNSSADFITMKISIHTLRMEGDLHLNHIIGFVLHFNPHPPHGG